MVWRRWGIGRSLRALPGSVARVILVTLAWALLLISVGGWVVRCVRVWR